MKYKKQKQFNMTFSHFYLLAVISLWIKTYVTQLTQFELGVQGALQHFLLFINSLGSAMLFLGFAFLSKRRKTIWLLVIHGLMSIFLYANVMFYRSFSDFLTWPSIFSSLNLGDMGGSIMALAQPWDALFFIDLIVLIAIVAFKVVKIDKTEIRRKKVVAIMSLALGMSFLNLAIAETDRPQLLTRGFDRNYIVKYLGMYNYSIYDAVESTRASAQRVLADSSDVTEVVNYTKANYAEPNPEYFGVAKDMNVIYIHLESIQEFLIGYELHGEEVTPFLNSMAKNPNTLYFDNFFHQVAQGKTADAEYMLENSLFGLPQGAAFMTKGRNTYQSLPAILAQNGNYDSAVFHGNGGGFWNRNEIYKSFGYNHFFDANYYHIPPEEQAEYGLMDKPFFEQSVPLIETLEQPFVSKFITVTHHHPYKMDQDKTTIAPATTGDTSVDNYFQTARYADEALAQFFQYLEESGLINNTMIVMYGDHYGISDNHNRAMAKLLEKEEITTVDSTDLQRVPLYIYVPGMEGGVNHTFGGQIDVLPTVLHLLGIDTSDNVHLGTDLLSEAQSQIVPFRNGDFVSPNVYGIGDNFYDPKTGLEITDEAQLAQALELREIARYRLELSDKIVNGDLLRFYTPEGFAPIDRSVYDYKKPDNWVINTGETEDEVIDDSNQPAILDNNRGPLPQ